ncbi:ATP-binding cassette domain-containing protein, partial [Streptococcus danieliae]|nr:ATP-binding cassette domain-containing protein [Streptococcus danieliae]
VNFTINNAEFVTLTGENGAAKSTLIKIILGILKNKTGEVFVTDKNVHGDIFKISYLPQHAVHFNSGFPTTVYSFVKSGLFRKNTWFKK